MPPNHTQKTSPTRESVWFVVLLPSGFYEDDWYFYDESGSPYGFNFTNSNNESGIRYFVRNLQGDIIESGSSTSFGASHKYDAWGTITETVLGSSTNAANFQYGYIFGYRGYQYDKETGLYYCQSRYYNPRVGRFLSADTIVSTKHLNGTNLYAYCWNNAVNYVDYNGEEPDAIAQGILPALLLLAVTDLIWNEFPEFAREPAWTILGFFLATIMPNNGQAMSSDNKKAATAFFGMFISDILVPIMNGTVNLFNIATEEVASAMKILSRLPTEKFIPAIGNWFSTATATKERNFAPVLITGGLIAMSDTPAPGPADAIALLFIGIGSIVVLASNPRDLEKGMSKYQKRMFQREIEDYKSYEGMPNDYNLPWAILVALAEMVKEMYNK